MSSLVITAGSITMSAAPGATDLGVTAYAEPTILAQNSYAPDSPWLHGSTALAWKYPQALLEFTVAPLKSTSEAAARALIEALRAQVSQLSHTVNVNVNGAGDETWTCDAGSVVPAGPRTLVNLRTFKTEWNVSIPCYPVFA